VLVRLLYASRSTTPVDEALVASILEKAQAYNSEQGLTGFLCTSAEGGVFLQVLEGGRAAVNELYGRILRDPRHRDVTLLDYEEIGERRFSTWRMGAVNLNRVNLGTILRFSESPAFDPFGMSGKAALSLLGELLATAAIVSCDGA
jgi:hypothetical protein